MDGGSRGVFVTNEKVNGGAWIGYVPCVEARRSTTVEIEYRTRRQTGEIHQATSVGSVILPCIYKGGGDKREGRESSGVYERCGDAGGIVGEA